MKLLVDMNLSPRWVVYLRQFNFVSEHWSNVGAHTALDHEILEYASAFGFIVLTHDLDFSGILSVTKARQPSVIQIRSQVPNHQTMGSQVVNAIEQNAKELSQGVILTIDQKITRIRLLPI
jgi:predicted nuclease of predicted toxin-antitoxin system